MGTSGRYDYQQDMEGIGSSMTEVEISKIRKEKSDFQPGFIKRIDEGWKEVMKLFHNCRYDLSKIRIVKKCN